MPVTDGVPDLLRRRGGRGAGGPLQLPRLGSLGAPGALLVYPEYRHGNETMAYSRQHGQTKIMWDPFRLLPCSLQHMICVF